MFITMDGENWLLVEVQDFKKNINHFKVVYRIQNIPKLIRKTERCQHVTSRTWKH